MICTYPNQVFDVLIVDPSLDDYAALIDEACGLYATLHVQTGDEALRVAGNGRDALWLVNTHLPDMTGLELAKLARTHKSAATIFLISDEYEAEIELAVRAAGLAAYFCKPPHSEWLQHWRRPPQPTEKTQVSQNPLAGMVATLPRGFSDGPTDR